MNDRGEAELGWRFSKLVGCYSHKALTEIITNIREALVWLVLGGHGGHHEYEYQGNGIPNHCSEDNDRNSPNGKNLQRLISQVTTDDGVWIVENVIRRASEFAVCRYLRANLFTYFVLHDEN